MLSPTQHCQIIMACVKQQRGGPRSVFLEAVGREPYCAARGIAGGNVMLKTELPHVVGRARGKIVLLARQVAQRITRRHTSAGVEVRGSSSGLLQLQAQMQEFQMRLKRLGDL